MKKVNFLCLAAFAALTFTSCSQDELSSPVTSLSLNAIGFDSYFGRNAQGGVDSRGSVNTVASVATSGFGVYAYQSTDSYTSGSGSFNPNLMSNVQVKGTSSNSSYTWSYSPVRYWPVSGYVSFLAYAPYASAYSLVNSSSSQDSGDKIYLSGFEVSSTIANQVDLLWNTNNVLNQQKPTDGSKVKMKFTHALSRIGLNITASAASEKTTVTIKSISLSGSSSSTSDGAFYKSGLLRLTETTTSTDLWSSLSSDKLAFTWESGNLSATALNNSTTSITNSDNSYLMVIPQDFSSSETDASSLYLTVTYSVKTDDGAEVENTVTAQVSQKFEASKAYTLKISIGLLPIEFDVETQIAGWDNASDVTVTI